MMTSRVLVAIHVPPKQRTLDADIEEPPMKAVTLLLSAYREPRLPPRTFCQSVRVPPSM